VSAVLSLLQSRLLRPVFVTLGIALLVQVLVAVALTRSTVTALEADLASRLGGDSQKLAGELEQAGKEVTSVWRVFPAVPANASRPACLRVSRKNRYSCVQRWRRT